MQLIQLLSFYEIVKTGSFSKASENVFRSQSTISYQIRNLENELEVKLFEKVGSRLKLTGQGEILLDVAERILDELENLKKIYEDMKDGKYGNLTIAATTAVMTYVLPGIVKEYRNQFPRIKLKLITCRIPSEIFSMISKNLVDFGIAPIFKEVLPIKMDFQFWKSFNFNIIAHKKHPLSKKKAIKIDDIMKYPLILMREGTMTRKIVEEVLARKRPSYEIVLESDNAENMKKYVELNIGISILSSIAIPDEDRERFTVIDVSHLFGRVDYGILKRKNKHMTTAMKEFINLFVSD